MKHTYWVTFPNGFEEIEQNGGTHFTTVVQVRSQLEAVKLMEKYDAAYFEKIQYRLYNGKKRNVSVCWWSNQKYKDDPNITKEDLYDIWRTKPRIEIRK